MNFLIKYDSPTKFWYRLSDNAVLDPYFTTNVRLLIRTNKYVVYDNSEGGIKITGDAITYYTSKGIRMLTNAEMGEMGLVLWK